MKIKQILPTLLAASVSLFSVSCAVSSDGRTVRVEVGGNGYKGGRPHGQGRPVAHRGHGDMRGRGVLRDAGGQHYRVDAGTFYGEPEFGNYLRNRDLVTERRYFKNGKLVGTKEISRVNEGETQVSEDEIPPETLAAMRADQGELRSRAGQQVRAGTGPRRISGSGPGVGRANAVSSGNRGKWDGNVHWAPNTGGASAARAFAGDNPNRTRYSTYAPAPPPGARRSR